MRVCKYTSDVLPPLPKSYQVRRKGSPVDLNAGTNGERTFLCYKRGTTNPIIDIQVLRGSPVTREKKW